MNGVDTDYFNPHGDFAPIAKSPDVVFVGAMDYRANIDAVLFFAESVWPLVRKKAPEATFAIVGANPDRTVETFEWPKWRDGHRSGGRRTPLACAIENRYCAVACRAGRSEQSVRSHGDGQTDCCDP